MRVYYLWPIIQHVHLVVSVMLFVKVDVTQGCGVMSNFVGSLDGSILTAIPI